MSKVKKIIAGYCRVSTDSRDQLNSFENQRSMLEYEAKKQDVNLFDTYSDKGLTGTLFDNRPGLENMLYDAGIDIIKIDGGKDKRVIKRHTVYEVSDREPLFEEIWMKNSSRLARNTGINVIIDKLRAKGVSIYFFEQDINTKDPGKAIGLHILQVFDEHDSRDKSLRVKLGIAESARKGKVLTNSRLYGYNYDRETNRLS